jgi:hypothetical protein
MKKISFFMTAAFAVALAASFALATPVFAAGATIGETCTNSAGCNAGLACINSKCAADVWGEKTGSGGAAAIKTATGLGEQDPRAIAASVINVLLGFLGIIAVVLIIAGGFMWMTAAGNDEKVGTARKIMTAGVIGLIIVLAAFGIAQFVVDALVTATK